MVSLRPTAIWGRHSASAGAVIWILLFLVRLGDSPETGLIQRIVLLGILVVVPLGLSLLPLGSVDQEPSLYKLALLFQPLAAVPAVISFFLEPVEIAAALVVPWALLTGLIALLGLARLLNNQLRVAPELSIDAGLLFFPIAGFWLVVSRLGIQLFGFGDTIILLTAVHFTFATYAALILVGLTGRWLASQGKLGKLYGVIPALIVVGTPLVAAGITMSPVTALIGAALVSLGLFMLAVIVIVRVMPRIEAVPARLLFAVSSFACATAMVLACIYAYSIVAKKLLIDIPQMAMTHGLLNAFGFVMCGLLAWTITNGKSQRVSKKEQVRANL